MDGVSTSKLLSDDGLRASSSRELELLDESVGEGRRAQTDEADELVGQTGLDTHSGGDLGGAAAIEGQDAVLAVVEGHLDRGLRGAAQQQRAREERMRGQRDQQHRVDLGPDHGAPGAEPRPSAATSPA